MWLVDWQQLGFSRWTHNSSLAMVHLPGGAKASAGGADGQARCGDNTGSGGAGICHADFRVRLVMAVTGGALVS